MPREITNGDIPEKLRAVYELAKRSDDTSTKNGAIMCRERWNIAHGFNYVLEEFKHNPASYDRPLKYSVTEHAERAVIYDAVTNGVSVRGATLVANWVACPDCARAIALCGVADVVCHKECMDRTPERWRDMVDLGIEILERRGVRVIQWSGKLGGIEAFMNGEIWYP